MVIAELRPDSVNKTTVFVEGMCEDLIQAAITAFPNLGTQFN